MTVQITTGAERHAAVADWLSAAAEDPAEPLRAWRRGTVALLRCGALFSAVRIPAGLVHAAAGATNRYAVDAYLERAVLGGPVVCDRYGRHYYALVPASTAQVWKIPAARCLGRGSWLGVPRPGMPISQDAAVYWSVPMDSPADLCVPGAVAQLVMTGRYREVAGG